MNDEIRAQIEVAMAEQGKRRVDLSRETGIAQPNITRMLSGRSGEVPEAWKKLFDSVGYKLVIVPKQAESE